MQEQQGWFGVTNGSAANLALVITDRTDLSSSFELVTPGLPCNVVPTPPMSSFFLPLILQSFVMEAHSLEQAPSGASWPDCALSTPPACERTCAAPFNHSAPFIYLKAKARLVNDWRFVSAPVTKSFCLATFLTVIP